MPLAFGFDHARREIQSERTPFSRDSVRENVPLIVRHKASAGSSVSTLDKTQYRRAHKKTVDQNNTQRVKRLNPNILTRSIPYSPNTATYFAAPKPTTPSFHPVERPSPPPFPPPVASAGSAPESVASAVSGVKMVAVSQRKQEPVPPAISGAQIAEIYAAFCSVIEEDNKVDVVRFMHLCEGGLGSRVGYRLTCALQCSLKHRRVDWATMAWYLDAPPCSTYNPSADLLPSTGDIDLYDEFHKLFPVLRSACDVRRARQMLRKHGGLTAIRNWLDGKGYLDGQKLKAEKILFARLGTEESHQLGMEVENSFLGAFSEHFV